ncbi:hypothetical protein GY631_4584 [Trichophyton interdigitale]|nr:hypothetical protein GY631_4584 [Trichophyton interdigitale]
MRSSLPVPNQPFSPAPFLHLLARLDVDSVVHARCIADLSAIPPRPPPPAISSPFACFFFLVPCKKNKRKRKLISRRKRPLYRLIPHVTLACGGAYSASPEQGKLTSPFGNTNTASTFFFFCAEKGKRKKLVEGKRSKKLQTPNPQTALERLPNALDPRLQRTARPAARRRRLLLVHPLCHRAGDRRVSGASWQPFFTLYASRYPPFKPSSCSHPWPASLHLAGSLCFASLSSLLWQRSIQLGKVTVETADNRIERKLASITGVGDKKTQRKDGHHHHHPLTQIVPPPLLLR